MAGRAKGDDGKEKSADRSKAPLPVLPIGIVMGTSRWQKIEN